jgi:Protein kinase domain
VSYMSPEQVSGGDSVDGRADIFSAGVVLYELLAGRKPFHADAPPAIIMKILHEDPPRLNEMAPGLPAQLVAAVNRALAKDPTKRFGTAGELARELQWIRKALQASGDGAAAKGGTSAKGAAGAIGARAAAQHADDDVPAGGRRKWIVAAGIGGVLLAAGLIAGGTLGRSTPAAADSKADPPVKVPVSIVSGYLVEVFDGGRMISNASETHDLLVASGKTLTIRAPEYLLDAPVRVEGKRVDYQAPAIGWLNVRTTDETCDIRIGSKDLGSPPITQLPIAAGSYRVDVVCPNGQNPPGAFVQVQARQTATATISR